VVRRRIGYGSGQGMEQRWGARCRRRDSVSVSCSGLRETRTGSLLRTATGAGLRPAAHSGRGRRGLRLRSRDRPRARRLADPELRGGASKTSRIGSPDLRRAGDGALGPTSRRDVGGSLTFRAPTQPSAPKRIPHQRRPLQSASRQARPQGSIATRKLVQPQRRRARPSATIRRCPLRLSRPHRSSGKWELAPPKGQRRGSRRRHARAGGLAGPHAPAAAAWAKAASRAPAEVVLAS